MIDLKVPAPAPVVRVNDSVRRLQIGIGGVLAVLLLVGLAGIISERTKNTETSVVPTTPATANTEDPAAGNAPLAELGVQASAPADAPQAAAPSAAAAAQSQIRDLATAPASEATRKPAR